jgi:glycogen debranching enzyme
MGPYISALVSIGNYSQHSRDKGRELLRPLADLSSRGMSGIPEVFDGDLPQMPGGCISQAWSVAEVLRAWHEDVNAGQENAYLRGR